MFLLVCLGGTAQENSATNVDFDSVSFSIALDTQAIPPSDFLTKLQTLLNDSDCNCKATVYYSITLSSMGKADKVKIIWGENICWS